MVCLVFGLAEEPDYRSLRTVVVLRFAVLFPPPFVERFFKISLSTTAPTSGVGSGS